MTRHTSRRALLQGAAVLTAVPVAALGDVPVFEVVGEPETIPPETPIARLYRQWEMTHDAAEAAWKAVEGQGYTVEDAATAPFDEERRRIEEALLAEPVTDLRDLAMKVLVESGEGCFGLSVPTTLEVAALAGRDFAKMPRFLFEKEEAQ